MTSLKQQLAEGLVLAPGVYDGLSALVAQQSGAKAVYLTGAGVAYTRFARPDLGLVDMNEVVQIITAIAERVDVPVIADGDNGFGNALNTQRTMRAFERAGATAIQLEDQSFPKRCGHLAGKTLISGAEMVGKIKAACDARTSEQMLVIARTDAVAVEGFDRALERARSYEEAGADVIFVEAVTSEAEMKRTVETFGSRVPLMVNLIEGGRTPMLPLAELEAIGFRLAIFPNSATRAIAFQLQALYQTLIETGSTAAMRERMLDFNGLNSVVGTEEMLALGRTYSQEKNEEGVSALPGGSDRQYARGR